MEKTFPNLSLKRNGITDHQRQIRCAVIEPGSNSTSHPVIDTKFIINTSGKEHVVPFGLKIEFPNNVQTIIDGIENTPRAFIGLFTGQNRGKMLVRV